MARSMRSASARPGIRSRSIAASGIILHFVSDILVRAAEKVLAVRQSWSEKNPEVLAALVRAAFRATGFIEHNRAETAHILAQPERIGVDADIILRTLDGRLKISPDGTMRESGRYLLVGREGAARPDPVQAAWLYAQMVRWGQAAISPEACGSPRRCSGRTSTMPFWVFSKIRSPAHPTTSWERSRGRRSMRRMLPDIWPPYGSLVGVRKSICLNIRQNIMTVHFLG